MKNHMQKLGANRSGQLFIVAALVIAILISSTTIYVYELSKEPNAASGSQIADLILALKQSTRNAVITSLANISNGGERSTFSSNLDEFSRVLRNMHNYGICQLDFSVFNDSSYDSGIWLSFDSSGFGVSSAYSDFALKVYSMSASATLNYAVNVTTTVTLDGSYTKLVDNQKLVNLTCTVYNEDRPALAENISIFYEKSGAWTVVDASNNLSVADYGNGTYALSFLVDISPDSVPVSAHVLDLRHIFVQTNTTCGEA